MRIQHNIMAMNAYRNYNNNNKALSGNLEKLSSGYKINRAGDDAAGLAISEKMRAQITGLNAAQKNVKDGISLVKTAEGAMQEIQDMLNRMDYLATQSANGTYDDEVDRANLQKEVEALQTEINRIADSANFNGIKLLDGSKDKSTTAADAAAKAAADAAKAVEDAQAALDAATAAGPEAADPQFGASMDKDTIKDMMLDQLGDSAADASKVGQNTVLETDKVEFKAPSFQVSMNGTKYTMASDGTDQSGAGGTDGTTAGFKLTVGGKDITLTEADMKAYLTDKGVAAADIKGGYTLDSEDLAAAIAHKINNDTGANGVGHTAAAATGLAAGESGKGKFNDSTNVWDVRASGDNIVFEFSDANTKPTTTQNKYFDTSIAKVGTIATTDVKATAATTTYTVTDGAADDGAGGTAATGNTKVALKATIDGKEVDFGSKADVAAAPNAAGIKAAVDALAAVKGTDADGNEYKFSDYFDVTINGQDIVFTDKTKGAEGSGNSVDLSIDTSGVTANSGTVAQLGNADTAPGEDAYTAGVDGYINAGTEVVIAGLPSESEQLASTTLDFSDLDIVDGMKVTLGNESYVFAVGADSKYKDGAGEGVKVVDLTNLDADELKTAANGGTQATRNLALSKLTEAAKGNEVFTVSHETNGTAPAAVDQIGLKQKAEVKDNDDWNMTTMDEFASHIDIQTVDADATAAAQEVKQAEYDAKIADLTDKLTAAQEAKTKADEAVIAAGKEQGKALKLQIGDTSDSFNQMEVSIGDMHVDAMGTGKYIDEDGVEQEVTKTIADINVGNQDDAAEAIQVIKNAINYVSGVRGDLGAIQNRLDHTANNLSVMAENIQDAESTIRDTDVAEEMMSYVKNNILVQSAQAMLAQANQVPQGVLQLLG